MGLLKDGKMSLLYFNFVGIYIIHTILSLLKIHLNYFKCLLSFFEYLFKKYNELLFF